MPSAPATQGVHHIGLTVLDLEKTADFFLNVLGYKKIAEVPNYPAIFVSDGTVMLTLWRAEDPENAISFDRKKNIGLHHFALRVENLEALQELHETLIATEDVEIEFPPEPLGKGPMQHMMCFIPGGIRMEFIALTA